jgi:thiol-disulfide isomerase/thioredoxin
LWRRPSCEANGRLQVERCQASGRMLMMIGMRTVCAIGILLVAVAAWAAETNAPALNETRLVKPSPAFTLKDLDNHDVSSTNFTGTTRLVLFWANWDEPSRKQLPALVELQRDYGTNGLQVLALSLDNRDLPAIKETMAKNGITFPVLMADYGVVQGFGGLEAIPTLFVESRGMIISRYVGLTEKKTIEKILRVLLQIESPK